MIRTRELALAYTRSAGAWAQGPARIYDELADALVACSPVPLAGRTVADVGAGLGAASRAVARVGGTPIALDLAEGMLQAGPRDRRAPGVVADLRALPVAGASLGAVVAAFSLNHLEDPTAGLAEAARVTPSGGPLLASAYAAGDDHPVKAAVDAAAAAAGWRPERWYEALRGRALPQMAAAEGARAAAAAAGLERAVVREVERAFPSLSADDLVAWRTGMAAMAPFLAGLTEPERRAVHADALERLGEPPVLVRRMIVVTAVA